MYVILVLAVEGASGPLLCVPILKAVLEVLRHSVSKYGINKKVHLI